jgi:chromosome segregation ATPase
MARQDAATQAKLRSQQEKIGELTDANDKLEERISKIKEYTAKIIQQKDSFREAKCLVELAADNMFDDNNKAQARFDQEIGIVWGEKKALQQTIDNLRAQLTELEAQGNKPATSIDMVAEVERLKDDLKRYQDAKDILQQDLSKLTDEREKLTEKTVALEREATSRKELLSGLVAQSNTLQQQLKDSTLAVNSTSPAAQQDASRNSPSLTHASQISQLIDQNRDLLILKEALESRLTKTQEQIDIHLKEKSIQDGELAGFAAECIRLRLQKGQLIYEKGELEKILASQFGGPAYTGGFDPFPEICSPAFSPIGAGSPGRLADEAGGNAKAGAGLES